MPPRRRSAILPASGQAGRPTILTPSVQAVICGKIEDGLSYDHSCLLAGISRRAFLRWRERGEVEDDGIYADFADAVDRASATASARLMETVTMAISGGGRDRTTIVTMDGDSNVTGSTVTTRQAPPDGRLALSLLERRFGKDYGKGDEEGKATAAVQVNLIFDDGAGEVTAVKTEPAMATTPGSQRRRTRPSKTA